MSVKYRSKHDNYAKPFDTKGKTKYFALECGHLVSAPATKNCLSCQKEKRKNLYPNFLRYEGIYAVYAAKICGHETSCAHSKYCRTCFENKYNSNISEEITKAGKPKYYAKVCGHLVSRPNAKYCVKCRFPNSNQEGKYTRNGKIWEHRANAEKAIGRRLKRSEIVHHINGDKSDNRNCNLLICSVSYHAYLHNRMSILYAREKFADQHGLQKAPSVKLTVVA